MPQTKLKYLILYVFIISILILVFLQFNANQNINELIRVNNQLKDELILKNDLQQLRSDILSIDAKIKGAVIANDTLHFIKIEQEVQLIRQDIDQIQQNSRAINRENRPLFEQLKTQVLERIEFSNRIISVLDVSGKQAAENIINQEIEKNPTQQILVTIQKLDESSEHDAVSYSSKTDNQSKKAVNWGMVTVIAACFFALGAFLFIAGRIKKQEELILALNEARKKEKELSTIKEQFLANMSHEIRTPMNAVLGFSRLLHKQPLTDTAQEYVSSITNSGEKLMSIINDILDISKIEAGMLRIENAPFSLRELIHSVLVMTQVKLEGKPVTIRSFVPDDIPDYLIGDSMRLTQILVNLTNNAAKFTDNGEIIIHIATVKTTEQTLTLQIEVKDTGIGIEPEKLPTVFDRFSQADADTTRKYGGTGLGLAIVKQLTDLMHGTVSVESIPGKGSTFTVVLPFEIHTENIPVTKQKDLYTHTNQLNQQLRILIAEDNNMNQSLMKHLMEDWKLNYTIVDNGKEATELLRTEAFDLLLLDIQMPLMNGYTAAEKIRNELNNKSLPIIAMTAHAMAGEREKCISYGMNDYISKPIREEELLELIRKYTSASVENKPGMQVFSENEDQRTYSTINFSYLKDLSKGNTEFEKEMIQEFIVQVPQQLQQLRIAVLNEDYPSIKGTAHNLKTSVSFLGLTEKLADILESTEQLATDGIFLEQIKNNEIFINSVCKDALTEANNYLTTI